MRYELLFGGKVAELSVQTEDAGRPDLVTVTNAEGDIRPRRFLLAEDAVFESQPDGSLKRFGLLTGRRQSQTCNFFSSGRIRSVDLVGGIGGRVESLASEGTVVAPMNGQVVKVVKAQGEFVQAGEIVLILEAMKMENEVTAPISGILKELNVAPGQTVNPGQPLFSLEAEES